MSNPSQGDGARRAAAITEDPTGRRRVLREIAVAGERYAPIAALGSGGMGRVVLCHDRRIGRDTAIKSLRPEFEKHPQNRARFLREARIQGQLDHPCVVPVYDIDTEEGALPSFSMRYVRGEALADVIDRLGIGDEETERRYTTRRLLTAFSSVCGVAHFAHARGVLHRDLKPENVMLGEYGEVYVLDWGVAVAGEDSPFKATDPEIECRTERGQVLGTPGFIAPEAWVGDHLDARADVYSLGVMLFELLTRAPRFSNVKTMDVMRATFSAEPLHPSRVRPELDIAPELDAICAKATALDRGDRYTSAGELREAVERYLDGDRDTALRQQAARQVATEAERLADAALRDGDDAKRSEALRAVGRTLALDPENASAMGTLVWLMLTPPREAPPEVSAALTDDWGQRVRAVARIGVWAYLSWLLVVPVLLWFGARDVAVLSTVTAVMLASAAVARFQSTRARPSEAAGYVMLATSTAAIAAVGLLVSPLVMVPTAIIVNTLVFLAHGDRMKPWVSIVAGACGLVFQPMMELLGLLPRTFRFEGSALVICPPVAGMRPEGLFVLMMVTQVLVLTGAGAAFRRAHRSARYELERVNLVAWNLRQIAPQSALNLVEPPRSSALVSPVGSRSTPAG